MHFNVLAAYHLQLSLGEKTSMDLVELGFT